MNHKITNILDAFRTLKQELDEIKSLISKNNTFHQKSEWIDVADACRILNICKRTIYSYNAKGILTPSRINGKLYYRYSDLTNLLNQ